MEMKENKRSMKVFIEKSDYYTCVDPYEDKTLGDCTYWLEYELSPNLEYFEAEITIKLN